MSDRRYEMQRGFTVPELLISLIILVGIGFATLGVLQVFAHGLNMRSTSQGGTVALEQQMEAMRSDAATAYAVFVPQSDVHGKYNAAAPSAGTIPTGHEVDFYSRTDTGTETWWAYDYDANAQTLQRFDYDATGTIGVADRNTGKINPGQQYPAMTGVTAFSAQVLEANQLTTAPSEFAPIVAGLTGGNVPKAEPVGFVPVSSTPRPDLYGGNVTVQVAITTNRGTRSLHLQSAVVPSGFTLHQSPAVRAVTYRLDVVHRFWFGLAQITHAQIFNQLLYSYIPSAPADKWKVWCDYEVYGEGTAGLTLGTAQTKYDPTNFDESAPGIYYAVSNVTGPLGENGTSDHNEQKGCHSPIPSPAATAVPVPASTDPDVIDTPPPCFAAGTCWPMDAPANWDPPSPWPSSTPPPGFCSSHTESPLCGGSGGGTPPPPSVGSPTPGFYEPPTPVPSLRPTEFPSFYPRGPRGPF